MSWHPEERRERWMQSYSRTRFRPTLSYFSMMIIAGPKQGPIIDLNQSGYYGGTKRGKYYIIITRSSNGSAQRKCGRPMSVQVADIPQVTALIKPELQAVIPLQHYSENPTSDSSTPFPTSERSTELSSPERTHAITLPSFSALTFSQEELRDTVPQSCQKTQDPATRMDSKIIPIHHNSQGDPSSDEPHPISSPVNSDDPIPLNFPCAAQSSEASNHTEPLPSRPAINSPNDHERNVFTAPLPVIPITNSIPIPYTFSVPLNESSPRHQLTEMGSL
ncbi:hypothetical protein L210DRAFT_3560198, partial [Boletus edulis BED1]